MGDSAADYVNPTPLDRTIAAIRETVEWNRKEAARMLRLADDLETRADDYEREQAKS